MYTLFHNSTLKQGCQAGIKLTLSEDKQTLVVVGVSEEHNHHVDKVWPISVYSMCPPCSVS